MKLYALPSNKNDITDEFNISKYEIEINQNF
jgi:hypothetical protein